MRRRAPIFFVAALTALAFGSSADAKQGDDPNVWDYAKKCFDRLEIKDAKDRAKLGSGTFKCTGTDGPAEKLKTQVDGHIKDLDECKPAGGQTCPTASFPTECDYPAWLEMGTGKNCYGHSFVQKVPLPSTPDVEAVLLCRHKSLWTTDEKQFNDIAMIVHNRKNGETCWFQTPDSALDSSGATVAIKLDGTAVPGPEKVRNHDFWLRPIDTAKVGCVGCHDNGAFMNSRWMSNSISLRDGKSAPYKNSEPPFDLWPQPHFIDPGKNPKGASCIGCHKIAAGGEHTVAFKAGDPNYKLVLEFQSCADCNAYCAASPTGAPCLRCRGWIQRATGRTRNIPSSGSTSGWSTHPKGANARAKAPDIALWMPVGRSWDQASWDAKNKDHVDHVMRCCAAVGKSLKDKKPIAEPNCTEYIPGTTTRDAVAEGQSDAEMLAALEAEAEAAHLPAPEPTPEAPLPVIAEEQLAIPWDTDPLPPQFAAAGAEAVTALRDAAGAKPDPLVGCWLKMLEQPQVDDRVVPWTRVCVAEGQNAGACSQTSASLEGIATASPDLTGGWLSEQRMIVHLRSDALLKQIFFPQVVSTDLWRAVFVEHFTALARDVARADRELSGASSGPYSAIRAFVAARKADPKSVYACLVQKAS